jgi:hypothetical protein
MEPGATNCLVVKGYEIVKVLGGISLLRFTTEVTLQLNNHPSEVHNTIG